MGDKSLESILGFAEAKERDAAREFAVARKNFESNQEKLNELRGFRDEYHNQDALISRSASDIHATRQFLFQLGEVIDHQERQVEITMDTMSAGKESWLGCRVKRRSIEVLSDIRAKQAATDEQRREQKELDEISNRCGSPFDRNRH